MRLREPGAAHRNPGSWPRRACSGPHYPLQQEKWRTPPPQDPDVVHVTRRGHHLPARSCCHLCLSPPSHYTENKDPPIPRLPGALGSGNVPCGHEHNELRSGTDHLPGGSCPSHRGQHPRPPRHSWSTIFSWDSLSPRRAWTQPPDCLNLAPRSWLEAWNPFAQVNPTGRKYE